MGIGEKNSALGKAVEIRRDRLRIAAHAANPVIQIIHRNEEDVGFLFSPENGRRQEQEHSQKETHWSNHNAEYPR